MAQEFNVFVNVTGKKRSKYLEKLYFAQLCDTTVIISLVNIDPHQNSKGIHFKT